MLKVAVQKVDLNTLAKDAVAGNIGPVVRDELNKILNPPAVTPAPAPKKSPNGTSTAGCAVPSQ